MNNIAIPVSAVSTDRLLKKLLDVAEAQLDDSRQQTELLERISTDVHSLWEQADETPVGFKIHVTKL